MRLFFLWGRVKALLDAVAAQPMMRAFGRLPVKVTEVFGRYLFTQRPHLSHLQVPAHQLRLLVEAVGTDPEAPAGLRGLGAAADEIEAVLADQLAGGRRRTSRRAERVVRQKLSDVAGRCLEVLAPRGRWLPVDDAFGGGTGKNEAKEPAVEPAWVGARRVGRGHPGGNLRIAILRPAPQPGVGGRGHVVALAHGRHVVPVPPGEAAPGWADRAERRRAWRACCTC